MKTFTDRQGRSWTIEINYTSLRRVKAATDVDLTRFVDPKSDVMGQLTGDPFVLFDCLVAILQPQLDERGLTAEQFSESLDEESADKAAVALIEAADIAAKIMAGMGLSADELGNTVDVMAKAMTTANTDLTMLGEAFKFRRADGQVGRHLAGRDHGGDSVTVERRRPGGNGGDDAPRHSAVADVADGRAGQDDGNALGSQRGRVDGPSRSRARGLTSDHSEAADRHAGTAPGGERADGGPVAVPVRAAPQTQ